MHLITTTNGQPATMSSREISDLTGKRHDNVMRDIRSMLVELHGEADLLKFEGVYSGANGEERPCFNLPKRESLVLVSGYNVKMRAAIIDRWQELEVNPVPIGPANMTRLQLIELAMQAEQERIALEGKVVEMTPKVAALDRIATADGSLCLMDAAKELQMRPKDLIAFMSAHQWIYKRAGGSAWIGYQDRIQAGLLEHKSNIVIDGAGIERIRDQVRVTAKGLARLAEVLEKEAA